MRSKLFVVLSLLVLASMILGACTTPTAGQAKKEAGSASDPAEQARIQKIWKGTTVGVGIGEAHNLVPAETEMVKAAVEMQKSKIKKCFEQPVLRRGCSCRTAQQLTRSRPRTATSPALTWTSRKCCRTSRPSLMAASLALVTTTMVTSTSWTTPAFCTRWTRPRARA